MGKMKFSSYNGEKEEERLARNRGEHVRRAALQTKFQDLNNVIPSLRGKKASRTKVLNAASSFILCKKREIADLLQNIAELEREGQALEKKLLERERESSVQTPMRKILSVVDTNHNYEDQLVMEDV